MSKRFKMSRGKSRRSFKNGANRIHPFNANVLTGPGGPMRGGIRL